MLEVLLLLAVIRIRGRTGIRRPMEDTLIKLRLTRINHMVLLPEENVYKGMLQRAKDYVTWGEVTKDVLVEALRERALLRGRKKPSEEDLKEKLGICDRPYKNDSELCTGHFQCNERNRQAEDK